VRAPSAGFPQGWGFLVLIIPHSNKDAYLDRCAQPDTGFADRSAFRSSGSMPTGWRSAFRRNSPRSERSPLATATSRHATGAADASPRPRLSTEASGPSRPH